MDRTLATDKGYKICASGADPHRSPEMNMRRFFKVREGEERYGGKVSAWRKWVLNGSLGDAVVRCGRLVLLDSVILDERLATTGQLLVASPREATRPKPLRLNTVQAESNGVPPNKKATDSHSVARREVRRADATTRC